MPEIGENLPNFDLPTNDGGRATNRDFAGKHLILFFYPRDDTPGCTKESIAFSQQLSEFDAANCRVVGVSKDSPQSHDKFIAKHKLSVLLLSDETGTLCEDLDVWREKSMYGKKFMGIERTTFLINPDGKIAHVWKKVKVSGHVEEVLTYVQSLWVR